MTSPDFNIHSLPPILINDTPLQYVELIKNLGIWLTPTLKWSKHVPKFLSQGIVYPIKGTARPHPRPTTF